MEKNADVISILAVDDQPENLLALEAIFTDPSLRLVKARSGKEALKYLLDEEFAVILMDAHMPVMDGFETAKVIRGREKSRSTPIIFLTAMHKDSMHASAGYDIGAVDYLFKPLIPEILQAKVAVFVELFKRTKEIRLQADRLKALNEELRLMTDDAAKARDQALSASRFKSEFLANMSHEIRTPMNGVLGMLEILLKSGLTEKQHGYATTAKEAGRALLAVINDILDFSKMEAGKLSLEISDFEPVALIESIAELLAAQAKQRSITLLTFIDPRLPKFLEGDAGRLRQIITNLAGNAIKFSDRGEVVIRAIVDSQDAVSVRVKCEITDQGIGLTQEETRRLFQPFVQSESGAHYRYNGTGLGLSISKQLVELMGGEIGVTSVKNCGSTFWFSIPMKKHTSQEGSRRVGSSDLSGVKVLVVDDESGAREILHNYLLAWGLHNDAASDAKEALSILRAAAKVDPYHIAIVDLQMPDMDGMHLGKVIRADESLAGIKLILLTAFDKPGIGEEAIHLGFDAYLTKPIKQSQLLNTISTLFQAPKAFEESSKSSSTLTAGTRRSELILVAEDHPINQKIAVLFLQDLGFEAHVAPNGNKVIELLKHVPYSLIFMDCQMPELDGFETTRAIRKSEAFTGKHIPIIAMTAHALEGSRAECIAAGMDDYLSKPVEELQLSYMLEKWLPRLNGAIGETYPLDVGAMKSKYDHLTHELIRLFLEDAPCLIDKLEQSSSELDGNGILRHAHTLKGICAMLYAEPMRNGCKEIETAIMSAKIQELPPLIDRLRKDFDELKEFLANCDAL